MAACSSTAKFKVPCNSSPLVRRAMAKIPSPKDFVKYFTKPLSSRCPTMKTTTSFTAPTDRSATSERSSFFTCKNRIVSSIESRPDIGSDDVQVFCVYEFNHFDRCGPHGAYLKLSGKAENSLGDLLPYTNTLYSGDLQKRLGITEGLCVFIQNKPEKNGDRYEAISSLYFGDFGHISIQGPYLTYYEDTFLAVTGGTGVFEGVYGQVRLKQLVFPSKIFYTFYLKGIKDLPQELVWDPVVPNPTDEPHPLARACEPNFTLPNYTD